MTENGRQVNRLAAAGNVGGLPQPSSDRRPSPVGASRRGRGAISKPSKRRRSEHQISPTTSSHTSTALSHKPSLSSSTSRMFGLLTPRASIGSNPDGDDLPRMYSRVSSGLPDPFSSWPATQASRMDENFDFLVHGFGPSIFGYERNDLGFDIFQTQGQFALQDLAAFHSLMTIAAMRRDQVVGRTIPGFSAINHRVEALRIINERFSSGDLEQCLTPGSIFAVCCLTGISKQWNAVGKDEFNAGLNQLILRKGGFSVIHEEAPVLEMAVHGFSTLTAGMLRPNLQVITEASSIDESIDVKSPLYSLLGFMRSVQTLCDKKAVSLRKLRQAFPHDSPAVALLTDSAIHPGILNPNQAMVQSRLRISFVLYAFSVLLYCSPAEIDRFMKHVHFVLGQVGIWKKSLRMLAWGVVANVKDGTLMLPKPAWQSYELLCAMTGLEDSLQAEIQAWLVGVLTSQPTSSAKIMQRLRSSMFAPTGSESPPTRNEDTEHV